MPVKKYIASVVMAIVLQQPLAASFLDLFIGKACIDYKTSMSLAWAEDIPVPQQEPAVQQAPQKPIDEKTPPADSPSKPAVYGPERGYVDEVQGDISRGILASAEWLDSFFEDKRAKRESNHSYLEVGYDIFTEDSTEQTVEIPSFNMQVRLPKLERLGEWVNLVFESEAAAVPKGAPVPVRKSGAQVLPAKNRSTAAALHIKIKTTSEQSFIIRTGGLLNIDQSLLFISPRYRLLIPLKKWDFRFTQDVIYRTGTQWQPKTEWETESLFDLERKLPYDLLFRSSIGGIWLKNTDEYFYTLGFSVRQPFGLSHAVSYGWSNTFVPRPSFVLEDIVLNVQYRHSVWRKWLFFEVVPQCRFPRDRDFRSTPGILLRLESYFGYTEK